MVRKGSCRSDCGACCKFMILPIDTRVASELEPWLDWVAWATLHGIEIKLDGRGVRAVIPIRCNALTQQNECILHDSARLPAMCAASPTCPEDLEGIEGCSYTFDKEEEE